MRIYLDSSALAKRAVEEPESDALEKTLSSYATEGVTLVSSALAWVEVSRAVRSRRDVESPARLVDLLEVAFSGIATAPISSQVIDISRRLGPPSLRSLDAIHLATAALLEVDVVCAYDARMLASASELGFATASPGVPARFEP